MPVLSAVKNDMHTLQADQETFVPYHQLDDMKGWLTCKAALWTSDVEKTVQCEPFAARKLDKIIHSAIRKA
ncbi:hypothetical protein [Marinicrinis lubricantis]|uniref:Uncharacterized protein n=1 Tax=Marinicrinis lubricantis TaxID=2086470 RepID=A0ABW1IUP6_9BACL